METIRRAVIDIGTNSVKMLVADVHGQQAEPVWEGSKQTRLGRGFYETHRLGAQPIEETARAVAEFNQKAREHGAISVRAFATSAARDALNADELISAVKAIAGLDVQIISGDLEATWAFRGVTTDARFARDPLLLLDVGGGSTEFILGQGKQTHFQNSFPLGTVRLMETIPPSDPPSAAELSNTRHWLREFLQREVLPKLKPAIANLSDSDPPALSLVGTGGTTSILARMELKLRDYDRNRMEGLSLSRDRVTWHVEHLWSLPLEERKHVVGLPPNRADVILSGVAIYEAIMAELDFQELRISTRGLRFAAVMEA
jgi:exopolyphosphatase/guanosine-5'-triphosphate,3'-diphosphate pyrophosphatase